MPETRRSARLGGSSQGSADSSPAKTGSKRKAASDASPTTSGKKSKKAQKTLEETMPDAKVEEAAPNNGDVEMKDDAEVKDDVETKTETNGEVTESEDKAEKSSEAEKVEETKPETKPDAESKQALDDNTGGAEAQPKVDAKEQPTKAGAEPEKSEPSKEADAAKEDTAKDGATKDDASKADQPNPSADAKPESNGNLIEEKHARDEKVASNITEKGIIYFFTRGRVNVEQPEGVQDLQRTFFVLRPIPTGAKLGDGPIDDSKTNRLFALPKKVFPESGKDRFMAFVEKAKVSMSELKEEFFQGDDYETKAGDTRHTPSVDPVGEGVYAITEVGRGSHLAYMLTIPSEPGKLQEDIGIHDKGSFALSLKNPKNKGPANTQLPQSPDFPESIMNDFRGLAWMPVHKSEYLDYPNAQLLLIGEGAGRFGGGAVEAPEGQKGENPEKELERLEGEDEVRVEALNGEDAVFEDLHVRKGEYSIKTTW